MEDVFSLGIGNPGSLVGDEESEGVVFVGCFDREGVCLSGVFFNVREQVGDDLREGIWRDEKVRGVGKFGFESNIVALQGGSE